MDRSDVIKLISTTVDKNDYGIDVVTETEREVYCNVRSVDRREFHEAGRNGLNPEFVFTMFFGDYDGEAVVEYHGSRYAVYRTYQTRSDKLELYVERKGGTNG